MANSDYVANTIAPLHPYDVFATLARVEGEQHWRFQEWLAASEKLFDFFGRPDRYRLPLAHELPDALRRIDEACWQQILFVGPIEEQAHNLLHLACAANRLAFLDNLVADKSDCHAIDAIETLRSERRQQPLFDNPPVVALRDFLERIEFCAKKMGLGNPPKTASNGLRPVRRPFDLPQQFRIACKEFGIS